MTVKAPLLAAALSVAAGPAAPAGELRHVLIIGGTADTSELTAATRLSRWASILDMPKYLGASRH